MHDRRRAIVLSNNASTKQMLFECVPQPFLLYGQLPCIQSNLQPMEYLTCYGVLCFYVPGLPLAPGLEGLTQAFEFEGYPLKQTRRRNGFLPGTNHHVVKAIKFHPVTFKMEPSFAMNAFSETQHQGTMI